PAGGFSFGGSPQGLYLVSVDPTTLPTGLDVPTADPDGLAKPNFALFSLDKATPSRTDLNFGYQGRATVAGTVYLDLDGDGSHGPGEPGLPGATVTLTWHAPDGVPGGDDVSFTLTSDGNGGFSFANLPPGNYHVALTGLPAGLTGHTTADFTLTA